MTDLCRQLLTPQDAVKRLGRINDHWHGVRPELDWPVVQEALSGSWAEEDAIDRLGLVNCFQWHLEDACRAARGDHSTVARLKDDIDRSNGRRVGVVDEINRIVADDLARRRNFPVADVRTSLTTPGDVVDRLSILELKRCHAMAAGNREVVRVLDDQLDDLCQGLIDLIGDLRYGRLRMRFFPTVKLYASANKGSVGGRG